MPLRLIGMEVSPHTFLPLELEGGERSALRLAALLLGKGPSVIFGQEALCAPNQLGNLRGIILLTV